MRAQTMLKTMLKPKKTPSFVSPFVPRGRLANTPPLSPRARSIPRRALPSLARSRVRASKDAQGASPRRSLVVVDVDVITHVV